MKTLLILLLPIFCHAQAEKLDSARLKNFVDSSGFYPTGVDLTPLHLSTAVSNNIKLMMPSRWRRADTVRPVRREFVLKTKRRKHKSQKP